MIEIYTIYDANKTTEMTRQELSNLIDKSHKFALDRCKLYKSEVFYTDSMYGMKNLDCYKLLIIFSNNEIDKLPKIRFQTKHDSVIFGQGDPVIFGQGVDLTKVKHVEIEQAIYDNRRKPSKKIQG